MLEIFLLLHSMMTVRRILISILSLLVVLCWFSFGAAHSASAHNSVTAQDVCRSLEGVYNWSYSGGSFQVELRPFGNFYCKSYPASATWALEDKKVTVDWKKFGKYELEVTTRFHHVHILPSVWI